MNLVDIAIIVVLILGAVVGYRRGFTTQFLSLCGFVVIVVAAFLFKNPVSMYLYEHLPFFNFPGILSGISVINLLLYEAIAFFIVFIGLYLVFKVILMVSHIFEKFLSMTILLGLPSKILGAILGILENYLVAFIILYIISLPIFNINIIKDSRLRMTILEKTPVLNLYANSTVKVGSEFWVLAEKYKSGTDSEQFNLETLNILLKYKVTSVDSVDRLVEKNKIQINNIESVLKKYRKD